MLTLAAAAAVLLAPSADVPKSLRNLAQMHQVVQVIELRRFSAPTLPADLPEDPWGTPYRIEGTRVVSAGSDCKFEENPADGQFEGTEGDVVFEDGLLVRSNRNWLYTRVRPGTDSAAALEELRQAELFSMLAAAPVMRELLLTQATIDAMQRGHDGIDAWGTPLRIEGTRLISAGADKKFDPMSWGRAAMKDPREDIVVDSGVVLRAVDPEALVREKTPDAEPIPQPVDPPVDYPGYRRVGGDVVAPKAIKRVEPRYDEEYRMARIQGIVILESTISDKGVVEQVRLVKSLAPDLDTAAMDAVKEWTFEPATQGGKPVPVIFHLTINFKLTK